MSAKKSGQKWIAKNRAPRVQIEYDVEVYGSEKKVQIPFVMGVMADLSGTVPNTLTGEGYMSVDVTFENMDDFSPAAVAKKVGALNQLLEARTQLHNLLSYMDGKSGAEELLSKVLQDPALMASLSSAPKPNEAPSA